MKIQYSVSSKAAFVCEESCVSIPNLVVVPTAAETNDKILHVAENHLRSKLVHIVQCEVL